jgi:hypothetical protein
MMRLDLDFIPRRVQPWAGWLLLAGALVWLGWVGQDWLHWRDAERVAQARLERVQTDRRAQARQPAAPDPVRQAWQGEQARTLAGLRYPWGQVLAEWEGVQAEGVTLLSFQHDRQSRVTRLEVEGRDLPALLLYWERLGQASSPGAWSLARHQQQGRDGTQSLRATLTSRPLPASEVPLRR